MAVAACLAGCSDDPVSGNGGGGVTALSDEWYAGGKLGTVFNSTSSAYEQSTPVVDRDADMAASFCVAKLFSRMYSFRAPTPEPNVRAWGRSTSVTVVLPAIPATATAAA